MMSPRIAILLAALVASPVLAQQGSEGGLPTQTFVRAESKNGDVLTASAVSVQVENQKTALTSITPVKPGATQVALLIDDGLSRSAGIELNDLRTFATSLPPDTELLVGYMSNGTVNVEVPFTTNHAAAATRIRMPFGVPGQSGGPYFCLDEFIKRWPGSAPGDEGAAVKARFVMMITNGVDIANGSTSILNQDSPYVKTAQEDAQRAGVSVSSIYFSDAGFRGTGSFSGQSYLQQVADATGGVLYNQGSINPVSLTPYFKEFQHDLSETYVATFHVNPEAGGKSHLARVKMNTTVPKLKLRYAEQVRPGNQEGTLGQMQSGMPE